jgi:hypothetical protein
VSYKQKSGCRYECISFGCLPLLAIVVFFFVGVPSWRAIEGWWNIRSALANAQSVKLVHFNPYAHTHTPDSEMIYGTKDLNSDQFSKVTWSFPPVPDLGLPSDLTKCIFDPHHKIVITDSTGRETVIKVCFLCDHIQIGETGEIFCTPFLWRPLLHKFFDEEGLPYTPDRYRQDYRNRLNEMAPSKTK